MLNDTLRLKGGGGSTRRGDISEGEEEGEGSAREGAGERRTMLLLLLVFSPT